MNDMLQVSSRRAVGVMIQTPVPPIDSPEAEEKCLKYTLRLLLHVYSNIGRYVTTVNALSMLQMSSQKC